jgi:putative endonuclease
MNTNAGVSAVYMLASRKYGTLYTGSTRNLVQRVYVHREALIPGFSSRYKTFRLVWFEEHDSVASAYYRERQIKKWLRVWKIELIEKENPHWVDLWDSLFP